MRKRKMLGYTLIAMGIAGGLFPGAFLLVAETGDIPDSIIALSIFVCAAVGAIRRLSAIYWSQDIGRVRAMQAQMLQVHKYECRSV